MIKKEEVFYVGRFGKPRGVEGEITLQSESLVFETVDCEYLVCDVNGLLVPFFMDEYRQQNDHTLYVKLEDVESAEAARFFTHREVFLPNRYRERLSDEEMNQEYFIGFQAIDKKAGVLGIIAAVNTDTLNILFVIRSDEKERLIPAVGEFIAGIDSSRKIIHFQLPDGLADI